MSWFTVGEIVVWLVLAAVLGVALGWLLHEIWDRSRAAEAPPAEPAPGPVAEPAPDPVADRRIKGNQKSMIYHAPGSPAYGRTHADAWFESEDDAVAAGYRKPKNQ